MSWVSMCPPSMFIIERSLFINNEIDIIRANWIAGTFTTSNMSLIQ
jgi:hypothetical protein